MARHLKMRRTGWTTLPMFLWTCIDKKINYKKLILQVLLSLPRRGVGWSPTGLRRWTMRRCPGPWGTTTAVRGRAGRVISQWLRRSVSATGRILFYRIWQMLQKRTHIVFNIMAQPSSCSRTLFFGRWPIPRLIFQATTLESRGTSQALNVLDNKS